MTAPPDADLINADFSRLVVVHPHDDAWTPSPQPGVDRLRLDRIGGEVARATTLVRFAPGSHFPGHVHGLGEEFLVLDGVFSDDQGDYPAGTYVRHPPGSRHAPWSTPGCLLFVKLRQMPAIERGVRAVAASDQARQVLYEARDETVTLNRLAPGEVRPAATTDEEILIVDGALTTAGHRLERHAWLRRPAALAAPLVADGVVVYWSKLRPFPRETEYDEGRPARREAPHPRPAA